MGVGQDLQAVVLVDNKQGEVEHLAEDNHIEDTELVQDEGPDREGNKVAVDILDTGYILQVSGYKADRA